MEDQFIFIVCYTHSLVNTEKLVTPVKPRWKSKTNFRGLTNKSCFALTNSNILREKPRSQTLGGNYQLYY